MATRQSGGWWHNPVIKVMTLVVGLAFLLNAAAIWGIVSFARSAEGLALEDLEARTRAQAHSLEAVLASRRDELSALVGSYPVSDALNLLGAKDAGAQDRNRREIERSLLLFVAGRPEFERLVIRSPGGNAVMAVGRQSGSVAVLPPREHDAAAAPGSDRLSGVWRLGVGDDGGTLEAVISVPRLMETAAPSIGSQLLLERESVEGRRPALPEDGDTFVVSSPVLDDRWPAPIRWTLQGREPKSRRLGSLTALEGRYRLTIVLNMVMLGLAVVLGVIGFQQVKRATALEAAGRQESRMRDLERQVMHRERLASIGQLAAGFAHEINNPLEGMSNYLGLLEADLRLGRLEGTLELAAHVREGVDRVAGITRQVLTFASPGGSPLAPVNLNEVLEETAGFVRGSPSFRQISVTLRTGAEALVVRGNRVTLGQLFLNLLINACQAQPDGGMIEVAAFLDGGHARVFVADCGPGIPPEELERVFEPFYSTRGSTGLGLSVCHGIATEHGGRITAMNRIEGGAIFEVDLPILRAAEGRAQA